MGWSYVKLLQFEDGDGAWKKAGEGGHMLRLIARSVLIVIGLAALHVGACFGIEAVSSLVINEVELNPSGRDAGSEWIEILNESANSIDLAGWTVTYTYRSEGWIVLSDSTRTLAPGELFVFTYPELMLRNAGLTILELRDPDGIVVYRTSTLEDEKNDGQTWQRFDLGDDPLFGDLWVLGDGTRGKPNEFDLQQP